MTNRQTLSATIIVFYLVPLLFFAFYSIGLMSIDKSWGVLSIGLLLIAIGSLILIFLLGYWEQNLHDYLKTTFLQAPVKDSFLEETAKVTALETNSLFNHSFQELDVEKIASEESKEFNLLHAALKESQEQQELLQQTIDAKNLEIEKQQAICLELQQRIDKLIQDHADYKLFSDEQLKQKQIQLNNLQSITDDQTNEIKTRLEQVQQLDTKVRDLSYEIKTLLYLNDETPSLKHMTSKKEEDNKNLLTVNQISKNDKDEKNKFITDVFNEEKPIRTPLQAAQLLKRCIQNAEKITGANHHTSEVSRYREFSPIYYAIDQRRLFESLKNESSALIVVCGPKDQKILFVNSYIKNFLGWSPEKFIHDFPLILQDGLNEWNKALSSLTISSEAQTRVLVKTKQGTEILLHSHFGLIPTGLFRNYTLVVLYSNYPSLK